MLNPLLPLLKDSDESVLAPRPKWVLLIFLFPLALYVVLRSFEDEVTHLIIPLFPVEEDKSFGFYKDFVRLCFNEMLWLSFFILLSGIFLLYLPIRSMVMRTEAYLLKKETFWVTLLVCLSFLCSLFVAYFTLDAFANSGDEYVYLYQAETLSNGRLWNEGPPLERFFLYSHIAQKEGLSVGRFPPGWPLLLSVPFWLGISPFLLNPILALITLVVFHRFVRRYHGPRVALWSLVSLALTSFFVFNSASTFSHTSCLLFILAFVYCLYLHLDKRSVVYGLLAGAFLGWALISRYFTAVLVFIPVLVYLVYVEKWKTLQTLLLLGVGAVPFMLVLFWYDYQITGNPLLPVTVWTDAREGIGFGVMGHTPTEAMEHLVRRILLFTYWCSPALLLLYPLYLFLKVRTPGERFLHPGDYFVLMMIVGYFFYHHIGGNQYGPRFWFEALPFLVLFIVRKVMDSKVKWAAALFAAGLIYGIVKMPFIIHREHRIISERTDIYKQVEKANIHNAVVLVASHTGIIRPMGILDLTRNGLDFKGDVIYAIDKGQENDQLFDVFPNRSFYRYIRDPEIVEGELIKVR
jgi:4-amino-4-deoxy-L-arabinose transferase-like glycosyltransferase